jgi:hypothetical protein
MWRTAVIFKKAEAIEKPRTVLTEISKASSLYSLDHFGGQLQSML